MKKEKILLINGSPKPHNSNSGIILDYMFSKLSNSHDMHIIQATGNPLSIESLIKIEDSDILVFAFPLYVDGIPSNLLYTLKELELKYKEQKDSKLKVYTVVNCGFYEGHQAHLSLDMMKNWCNRSGLQWCGGVGIGAGGMIQNLKSVPEGQGPRKNIDNAISHLVNNINEGVSEENFYISPNFPKLAYKLAAEYSWRSTIKKNGLKTQELHRRIL